MSDAVQIRRVLESAMTVAELIEELESLPGNCRVVFACDYGDHSHTQQLLPVETADEYDPDVEAIEETGYSRSGLEVLEREEGGGQPFDVVVLR